MRRVAEIIYIVENEREEFLKGCLNMDQEACKVLWLCGVRKQQYFALNEFIFMTFEYDGQNFKEDMQKMSAYLESKGHLVEKRRKDVPVEEREATNWWAPVKRLASFLDEKPVFEGDEDELLKESYMASDDGSMSMKFAAEDIAFDEDEWMDTLQIWKN